MPTLICRKRDGGVLLPEEIARVVADFTAGTLPDSQMAALCMAIFFRGLSDAETAAFTTALRDSGRVAVWPSGTPPKIDKHSTGGIGDKVSLILAPLLACEDFWVPMVSGRGLGITGGTLDKLEAIPGFDVAVDEATGLRQLEKIGVFMAGQTADFCPADKRLYALRDVTGTVPSRGLIIASIMSKKLAESLDRLILDVKYGSGAFMKTLAEAETLAHGLAQVGTSHGVETSFLLSPMDEPLGRTVGNALEVGEAVATLKGQGPADLVALTLDLACGVSHFPREKFARRLEDGTAWEKFVALVEAQGGDARPLDDLSTFHAARVIQPFPAPRTGCLTRMDAGIIGEVAVRLGAGRHRATDAVDPSVGFGHLRKCGEHVEKGDALLLVHASSDSHAALALEILAGAVSIT